MATIVIPQTVPSPSYAAPPPLDFSKLVPSYQEGVQFGQQQAVHNAFAGGIPTTDGTPNGPTDYSAVFRKFMQVGDYDDANKAMQAGIQMQGMQNTNTTNAEINGTPSAPGTPSAAPVANNTPSPQGDYNTNVAAHESSGGTASANIYQFTPDTWAGIAAKHPELNLPPTPEQATPAQQAQANTALAGNNGAQLAQAGLPVNDKTIYMAHFLGAPQAASFLTALGKDAGQAAAPLFPNEAAANPSVFYNKDGSSKNLAQVYVGQTGNFSQANTTGINFASAMPRSATGGPTAQAANGAGQPTGPTGGIVPTRPNVRITDQPTPDTSVLLSRANGQTMPVAAKDLPAVNNLAQALAVRSAQDGGATQGGAAAPAGGLAAATAARAAAAQTSGGGGFGTVGPIGPPGAGVQPPEELAQGDSGAPTVSSSYAQNLSSPPPSNPSARASGGAASQQSGGTAANGPLVQAPRQSASSQGLVNGTNDPTLNGLVPPGLVAKFTREGIPPEQWAGNAVAYLTTAASRFGVPPASAEAWRQLAGEIGQTLRLRSTPNPALKEIDAERQIDPTTGQPETNSQVIARIAQTKATAEAQGKANVEAGTASQIAEQESSGKALGELPGKFADAASSARVQNNSLDEMQTDAAGFRQGWGADHVQGLNAIVQGLGQMTGIDTSGLDKRIGSYQDFLKISSGLVRQATRETSPRAAFQEMQFIEKTMPSAEMSPDGFGTVTSQMKGQNDYTIAKQQASQGWQEQHNGSLKGFEADWNKNVTPAAFWFHRMQTEAPQTLAQTLDTLKSSYQGRAMLAHVRRELTWANGKGLFEQ